MRCVHEASLWEDNLFVTLTYDDENVERLDGWSLDLEHYQLFMKRLRKRHGAGIRFFHCGEYGDRSGRPHYHALLFNFTLGDLELWKTTRSGDKLYTSRSLAELWPLGFSVVGSLTFETAAYVARYSVKKITGKNASPVWFHPRTGELQRRKPEYCTMSRRPGIGKGWLDRNTDEVKRFDSVVVRGREMAPPKYYDGQFELSDPRHLREVKAKRKRGVRKHAWNNTSGRHRVRENVTKARLSLYGRNAVDET